MDPHNNSHKAKRELEQAAAPAAPKKEIKRVVQGEIQMRKTPFPRRLAESLFAGRADIVAETVVKEVFLPAAKNTVADMCTSFINNMIFGGNNHRRAAMIQQNMTSAVVNVSNATKVNYSGISSGQPQVRQDASFRGGPSTDFSNFTFDTRHEAEELLHELKNNIATFNATTVADFYEHCNQTTSNRLDVDWGWTDLSRASVQMYRGRYYLDLPAPRNLD